VVNGAAGVLIGNASLTSQRNTIGGSPDGNDLALCLACGPEPFRGHNHVGFDICIFIIVYAE
jgi:hypothetical protein